MRNIGAGAGQIDRWDVQLETLLSERLLRFAHKKPLAFDQDKRLHNSEREIQADQFIRSTWYQSNHILLLILIWAHFTKAIFLALEDSLPLAHIEDSGRDGLHGVIPFCRVLFLVSKGTIPHLFGFVIQLVVKKKGQGVQRADSRQQYCPLHVAGGQTNG